MTRAAARVSTTVDADLTALVRSSGPGRRSSVGELIEVVLMRRPSSSLSLPSSIGFDVLGRYQHRALPERSFLIQAAAVWKL